MWTTGTVKPGNKQSGSSIRELLFGIVEFSCRRRGFSRITVLIPAFGILEIMECNHTLTPPPLASAGTTELSVSCKMKKNTWIVKCFQSGKFREMLWQNLVLSLFPSALFEDHHKGSVNESPASSQCTFKPSLIPARLLFPELPSPSLTELLSRTHHKAAVLRATAFGV